MTIELAIVTASNDSKTSGSDKSQRRLIHDLQGPLINIKGFSAEIQTTLTVLHDLLVRNQEHVPSALFSEMEQLINQDLKPCVDYLDSSSEALGKTIINMTSVAVENTNIGPSTVNWQPQ